MPYYDKKKDYLKVGRKYYYQHFQPFEQGFGQSNKLYVYINQVHEYYKKPTNWFVQAASYNFKSHADRYRKAREMLLNPHLWQKEVDFARRWGGIMPDRADVTHGLRTLKYLIARQRKALIRAGVPQEWVDKVVEGIFKKPPSPR